MYFGENIGKSIAEIGCGYGGQALVLDALFQLDKYSLYDLPLVNKLISKYLESYILNGSYQTTTLNRSTVSKFDLVLSNYAFSELPKHIQLKYVEKVLANSSKGYLTMNSGKGGKRSKGKLSIEELEQLIPNFEVFEENPKTSKFNYIIVWGHKQLTA